MRILWEVACTKMCAWWNEFFYCYKPWKWAAENKANELQSGFSSATSAFLKKYHHALSQSCTWYLNYLYIILCFFFFLFFLEGDRMAMSQATLVLFIARHVQRKSVAQFEDTISFYLVCTSSWPWKSSVYCCILFLLGMHRACWSCAFSLLFKSKSKLFRTWKHKTNETHQTCHKCYWRMLQLWEQRHKLKKLACLVEKLHTWLYWEATRSSRCPGSFSLPGRIWGQGSISKRTFLHGHTALFKSSYFSPFITAWQLLLEVNV